MFRLKLMVPLFHLACLLLTLGVSYSSGRLLRLFFAIFFFFPDYSKADNDLKECLPLVFRSSFTQY